MSKTFFTSDMHYGHKNIIAYCNRPYDSVESMNEALISNYNSVVGHEDVVWFIGDVFFCDASQAKQILSRLNGKKRLILGNHDKMIRNQKPVQEMFEKIYPDLHEENINGTLAVMCHYPMLEWNRSHRGSFMLHGHSHGKCNYPYPRRIMDVGVDANNYTPIEWSEVKTRLEKTVIVNHKTAD